MWRHQNRFLIFKPVSIENSQFLRKWMTFIRLKTNCTKSAHYRLKIRKVIEFFDFLSLMQHPLYMPSASNMGIFFMVMVGVGGGGRKSEKAWVFHSWNISMEIDEINEFFSFFLSRSDFEKSFASHVKNYIGKL